MAAIFINVDLEIEARQPLDYVCAEFSCTDAHHLFNGKTKGGYLATFECASGGPTCDPDSIINEFCDLIEHFDDKAKAMWNAAYRRTFDIGYEATAGDVSGSFRSELKSHTVERIAALGASVVITFYPKSPDETPSVEALGE